MTLNPRLPNELHSRPQWNLSSLVAGIQEGNTAALARAITLAESQLDADIPFQQELFSSVKPPKHSSRRIAISGVPGAGKSTFIEKYALHLLEEDSHAKIAVLAIDPSSTLRKGSLLGDKTRMEHLGTHPRAYVRPSPTRGTLGGVTSVTRQAIVLCEAAGFTHVLVETVGVGQSEMTAHSLTDCFLLLLLPGAGDGLQGIKRGIMEMADVVLIHKSDRQPEEARAAALEGLQALRLTKSTEELSDWMVPVIVGSSATEEGLSEVAQAIDRFFRHSLANGQWIHRRRDQEKHRFQEALNLAILNRFYTDSKNKEATQWALAKVESGSWTSDEAVDYCVKNG